MNDFRVIGNICATPELMETSTGIAMCKFSVAVKRDYTKGDGEKLTDFFNCVCYRGLAENISRYCDKGSKVYLAGKLELRGYEDNQGVKRTAVDFIVDKVEFLNTKKESNEEFEEPQQKQRPANRKKPTLQDVYDDTECPF